MRRASTSLPVPDSPTISTVQSLPATRRARSTIRREEASTATGSSVWLKFDSMLIGNLNSLGRCGQWLQLQLPCPPFRVMRFTRVTTFRRNGDIPGLLAKGDGAGGCGVRALAPGGG